MLFLNYPGIICRDSDMWRNSSEIRKWFSRDIPCYPVPHRLAFLISASWYNKSQRNRATPKFGKPTAFKIFDVQFEWFRNGTRLSDVGTEKYVVCIGAVVVVKWCSFYLSLVITCCQRSLSLSGILVLILHSIDIVKILLKRMNIYSLSTISARLWAIVSTKCVAPLYWKNV